MMGPGSLFPWEIASIRNFFNELHRRRVFRMLAYYVVTAWLLLQAADVLFPAWDIPERGIRYVLYAAILGLPVALVFSWFFDIGAEGIRRTPPADSNAPLRLRGRDVVLLGALVAVMGAIALGTLTDLRDTGKSAAPPPATGETGPPVVAVLPFSAEGTEADSKFFAEGIYEDLLTQLSRLGSLRVISRSSVQGFRDADLSPRQIGKELGVGMIVEGVVRVLGDQLRITTRLIDASDDALLWAESYDRALTTTDLFGVQGEIAQSIASGIGAKLTPEETAQLAIIPTESMAAYRAYRTATGGFDGRETKPEFIEALERAIELDPVFVQPMAELAGAYALRSRRPTAQTQMQIERAESLIDRLNQLAPGSVDHLFAQAYYVYYVLNEYDRALALADRALAMSPSNLRLLQLKSWIQRRSGDLDGRAVTLRRMMQLDPLQPRFRNSLLGTLFMQHRYDELSAYLTPADAQNPSAAYAYGLMAGRHLESLEGRIDALAAVIDPLENADPWVRFSIPFLRRDYPKALAVADTLVDPPHWPDRPLPNGEEMTVLVYWATGDQEALQALVDAGRVKARELVEADPARMEDFYLRRTLVLLDALEGKIEETISGVRALEQQSRRDLALHMDNVNQYCGLYAMVGAAVEAVTCLRTGLQEPSSMEPFLEPWLPIYDPVRESPEFQQFLAEL